MKLLTMLKEIKPLNQKQNKKLKLQALSNVIFDYRKNGLGEVVRNLDEDNINKLFSFRSDPRIQTIINNFKAVEDFLIAVDKLDDEYGHEIEYLRDDD